MFDKSTHTHPHMVYHHDILNCNVYHTNIRIEADVSIVKIVFGVKFEVIIQSMS
jgi:hypothetical protein